VVLPLRFLKPGAVDAQNLVTISDAKLVRNLGSLRPSQLSQLDDASLRWLRSILA
jgi:hypothetical protein